MIDNGIFVPNDTIFEAIEYRITQPDCENGYILDGFPRNLEQAKEYDKILEKLGYDIGTVILLDIDRDVLEKRITGRRLCEECNTIYNINDPASSPKQESVCDKCGGKLYQRDDDNLESFNNRYNMYIEKTEPIIDYYEKKGVLHKVNGASSIDEVAEEVDRVISND